MATTVDPSPKPSALAAAEADCGRGSRETILLSDVPDAETLACGESIKPAGSGDPTGRPAPLADLDQHYDILGELGRGSSGVVYKVRDRQTQHVLALKLFYPEFAQDRALMDRTQTDLVLTRKVAHRCVRRVYEFNRAGERAYQVMEFVEGESLRSVLQRSGGLPLRKALEVALQLCAGLRAAHAQGLMHRALKPENVLIDSRGNAKITDFASGRFIKPAAPRARGMASALTYLAPEQLSGKPADHRADIYSLGLLLYEVFTGKAAFAPDAAAALAGKNVEGLPIPPHEIEPTIPVSVERAILRCLQTEPEKRFPSVTDFEDAITACGTRAILASNSKLAQTLASRETVPQPPRAALPTVKERKKQGRIAVFSPKGRMAQWALGALFIVTVGAVSMHWIGVSRGARALPPPGRPAAPAPPGFALDKDETIGSPARKAQWPTTMTGSATAPATATAVNATGLTYLWIGRFTDEEPAREAASKIEGLSLPALVVPRRNPNGEFFVVLAGPFNPSLVPDILPQLGAEGFTNVRAIKNLNLPERQDP